MRNVKTLIFIFSHKSCITFFVHIIFCSCNHWRRRDDEHQKIDKSILLRLKLLPLKKVKPDSSMERLQQWRDNTCMISRRKSLHITFGIGPIKHTSLSISMDFFNRLNDLKRRPFLNYNYMSFVVMCVWFDVLDVSFFVGMPSIERK
jgi:hypothetical protein